jgi:cell wall-associated NlpC family hydrolase
MRTVAIIVAAAGMAFVLLIVVIVGAAQDQPAGGGAGVLNVASVPAAFGSWLAKAAALCPQIGAPLLAAQLKQESGFNPSARSPVGALGAAQFMSGTWPSWGRDDDGNGVASPFDVGDAVMAQGRYMCALAAQMAQALAAGRVHGTVQDLALAAYNAGPGGVLAAGGIPHNGETDSYVARIDAGLATFGGGAQPGVGPGLIPDDSSFGANVVLAARRWLGAPYVWGGGSLTGPTSGGFDCSGLALHAVYTASGGRITLPHNAAAQSQSPFGTPVTTSQLQPGDLLFFANSPTTPPHHVGIYLGNAQMIDAPETGVPVRVTPLTTPYYTTQTITARRFT